MRYALRRSFVAILVGMCCLGWSGLSSHAAAASSDQTDPFGYTQADYSSWGLAEATCPYDSSADGRPNAQGCFPVGNGLVFATLGVDGDFNTLTSFTGPGYQTRDQMGGVQYWQPGNWPDLRVEPRWMFGFPANLKGGVPFIEGLTEPLVVESQSIMQLRGAAMVRTVQETPHGTLYGLTYAVPGIPVVIREFAFAHAAMPQLVTLKLALPDTELDGVELLAYQGDKQLTIQPSSAIAGEGVILELGTSEDERLTRFAFALIASKDGEPRAAVDLDPASVAELRARTYRWWQDWSAGNLQFATGDQRLDDLLTQLPVIIETQRDAASGGVSPLVSYHGYWVRDSLGPISMYLLNGRFDEVMRMLTYHRKACWLTQNCSMLVPLDLDVSGVEEPTGTPGSGAGPGAEQTGGPCAEQTGGTAAAATQTWDGVPVEHAEVPSLIVLEHYWLWLAMHEAGQDDAADTFIREAWPFITHNLKAMQFNPIAGVRFHGDETYTNGALYSTYDREESSQIGFPNGYIPTEYFSFDNTLWHDAAANAMANMAAALGETSIDFTTYYCQPLDVMLEDFVQTAPDGTRWICPAKAPGTLRAWPWQFSNIALAPLWPDLPYSADLPVFDNYLDACEQLSIGPYPWTTPASGYMTGHALGYWLNAELEYETRNHYEPPAPRWRSPELVQMLLDTATPEGAWCEVLDPDGRPVNIYGRVNRIRPWESGMNYAALVRYCRQVEQGLVEQPVVGAAEEYPAPVVRAMPRPDAGTQVLAITIDTEGCRTRMQRDARLRSNESTFAFWDAGLPFTHDDLYRALMFEQDGIDYIISYLYIDDGVMDGLDRRTFKDTEFWQGPEMQEVLSDYQAAGGVVITPDTLDTSLAEDEVAELKLLIVLYPRTFTWEMDEAAIADFHKEIAKWACWFDEVAGEKLQLRLDFMQIDRRLPPLNCGPQGGNVYWMSYSDIEDDLRARGIEDGQYDSVCCFWAWDREAPSLPDGAAAAQAYGGAAIGPGDDVAFLGPAGRTSYYGAAVLKSHFVTTGRVALHEYLHSIDAMFTMAGLEDKFFSSDDMEQHMPEMLAEQPGCYTLLGYSDAEMLELAGKSARGEAGFPWRTQLVYYRWMLERTPKADFGGLIKRYGARAPLKPRTRLYDAYWLPEGDTPYQIMLAADAGLAPITIEDIDPDDGYVHWRSQAWGGAVPEAETRSYSDWMKRWREAELVMPDLLRIDLSQGTPQIQAALRTLPAGLPVPGASVTAQVGSVAVELVDLGDGTYSADLPGELKARATLSLQASVSELIVSPQLAELDVSPGWTLGYAITQREISSGYGVDLKLDGPPGEYLYDLLIQSETSTARELLADANLLQYVYIESQSRLNPGGETWIGEFPRPVSLAAAPATVKVTRTSPEGIIASFTHHIPPAISLKQELGPLQPKQVPDWVVKAVPLIPVIDGELTEWPAEPGLTVTPETGRVFNGRLDGPQDAAARLWLAYDADTLYVAGHVTDDQLKRGEMWDSDRLNLVFDAQLNSHQSTYPNGATEMAGWQADDFWVLICPFAQGVNSVEGVTQRIGGEVPTGRKNGYFGDVYGAHGVAIAEPGGYRFEWALPLATLPDLKPEPGSLAGFTFFLTDHDQDMAELMYLTDWSGAGGIEWRFWDCGLVYFEP